MRMNYKDSKIENLQVILERQAKNMARGMMDKLFCNIRNAFDELGRRLSRDDIRTILKQVDINKIDYGYILNEILLSDENSPPPFLVRECYDELVMKMLMRMNGEEWKKEEKRGKKEKRRRKKE